MFDAGDVYEIPLTQFQLSSRSTETQQQQQKRQLQSNHDLVDPSTSSSPNGMMSNTDAGISDKIANSVPVVIHRMLQSKVDEQAKEIVRLKQLIEKKCLENEALKDLLKESMRAKYSTVTGWEIDLFRDLVNNCPFNRRKLWNFIQSETEMHCCPSRLLY